MFSPYYAWARQRGHGLAERHCALNVALYGPSRRWTMTERSAGALVRDRDTLGIGPSSGAWDGSRLSFAIAETTAPVPRPVRGRVTLRPDAVESRVHRLDAAGRHRWRPIAPCARIEVAFDRPAVSWRGDAYFDTNWGDRPLEADFDSWNWSRAALPDGDTVVTYDPIRTGETVPVRLAMRYPANGGGTALAPPPLATLPPTLWRLRGTIGADRGTEPVVTHRLEDAPFYARSVVRTRLFGADVRAMHETLSLRRFGRLWVQAMLPFRMPRVL